MQSEGENEQLTSNQPRYYEDFAPSSTHELNDNDMDIRHKYNTAPLFRNTQESTTPDEKNVKALTVHKKKVKYPSLKKGVKKRLGVRRVASESANTPLPVYFKVVLEEQPVTPPSALPNMLYIILEYLYSKQAYLEEGIFRIGGSVSTIQRLSRDCDKAEKELLSQNPLAEHDNPHDVASLLKLWLKELPEPLIPTAQFQAVVDINRTQNQSLRASQWATQIALMPTVNRACLKHILSFATLVIAHSESNMMKLTNVANVLAPTIMRTKDDKDFLTNFGIAGGCVVFMLEHFEEVFGVYEPLDFMIHHLGRRTSVLSVDLTMPA